MRDLTCRMKNYIQPFERSLALEELRALTSANPMPVGGKGLATEYKVRTSATTSSLTESLAYWQTIGAAQEITSQLRSEATSLIARNGLALEDLPNVVPRIIDTKLPNRRCLRYATHGLHEYRGKFFPQLVRALINMAKVPPSGIIVDPMCGSGTSLVESILAGRNAYGLDMNPLSVFIATVKCQALSIAPKTLVNAFSDISVTLQKKPIKTGSQNYFSTLSDLDRAYLEKWFAPSALEELNHVQLAIDGLKPAAVRDFFRLSLSNILRGVSWQKDADLRVRKEVISLRKGEVIERFIDEARRSTKTVVAFVAHRGRKNLGNHEVHEADARVSRQILSSLENKVDAVITSPPYATALPYLDTDRLSLIYLGLLPRDEHRFRDSRMIGNREVTERTRKDYWETFETTSEVLPKETRSLIAKIDRLNKKGDVGFRRRNLAALLAKYFFDMRGVIEQQHALLRPGGVMFMVVGNNQTTAGGEAIEIQTTHHLAKLAESVGFRVAGKLSMEMLSSRDIFRKNAMASEQILTLQKDQ